MLIAQGDIYPPSADQRKQRGLGQRADLLELGAQLLRQLDVDLDIVASAPDAPEAHALESRAQLARQALLGEAEQAAVDALTKSIVNKILHAPVSRLKQEAEREEGMAYLEVARVLFGLDDELNDE